MYIYIRIYIYISEVRVPLTGDIFSWARGRGIGSGGQILPPPPSRAYVCFIQEIYASFIENKYFVNRVAVRDENFVRPFFCMSFRRDSFYEGFKALILGSFGGLLQKKACFWLRILHRITLLVNKIQKLSKIMKHEFRDRHSA